MIVLTGFGDEIGPDLKLQMDTLASEGIKFIELRGVNDKNVMKLTQDELKEIKSKLDARGFGISSIGSPIGKIKISDDFGPHLDDFKRAMDLAKFFGTPYIRIFSYYPPEGKNINDYRDEVMKRTRAKVDLAKKAKLTLLLENESNLYGESPENCLDVLKTMKSPNLKAVFDPANFILKGYKPFDRCWPLLKKYTVYFHIKDAKEGPGNVIVPAGEGDGQVPEVLADALASGFSGFMSLEPHLSKAAQFAGFSGPDRFITAIRALKKVLDGIGAKY